MKTSTKLTATFAAIVCTMSSLNAQRQVPVDAYTTRPELFVTYRRSALSGEDDHLLVYTNGRVVARTEIPGSDSYLLGTAWLSSSEVSALQNAVAEMFSRRLSAPVVCPRPLEVFMHEMAGFVNDRWNTFRTCDPNADQEVLFSWMTILHQQTMATSTSSGQSQTVTALEDEDSGITVLNENSVHLWDGGDDPWGSPIAQGSLTSLTGADRGVTVFESGRVELWENSSDNVVEFFDMNPTDTQNFVTLSEQAATQLAGAQSDQYGEDKEPVMIIDYIDPPQAGGLKSIGHYYIIDYFPSQFSTDHRGMAGADGVSVQPQPIQQQINFTKPWEVPGPSSEEPQGMDFGSSSVGSDKVPPRDLFNTVQVFDKNHRAIMILDDDCSSTGPAGDVFQLILGLLCR